MKPILIDTFLEFRFVSNPTFSPDGRSIAFIVKHADRENNCYRADLYCCDVKSKQVKRLTTSQDVEQYMWTAGNRLIFSSPRAGKRENSTDYYELNPDGGEALKVFELPFTVSMIRDLDGDHYLIAAEEFSETQKENQDPAYEVIDEIPFWFNGKGFTNGKRTRLYIYQVSSSELKPVSEESAECGNVSVRGTHLLYLACPWQHVRDHYSGIYLYDMESGENRCLLPKGQLRVELLELWSDEQALVAAADPSSPYGSGEYPDFYTLDLESGEMTLLAEYEYNAGINSVGTDARLGSGRTSKAEGDCCYFVTTRGSSAGLYAIGPDGVIKEVYGREGSCDSFDISGEHLVVCGSYGGRLPELYLDGEQLTFFNNMEQWQISAPEAYCFRASDGYELTGWVLRPAGYQPGRQYPAVLTIHGGPRTVFGTIFHHEMQVLANAGYFVLYTNPRGSDGFGAEFGDINGKYGTVDYQNLMDFIDYVLARIPDIDCGRLGVIGGSYGGFMTNWMIGHTDRFAAAVSQRSIANWISFEYMSDIGHTFTKDNQAVTAAEDVNKLWHHSPLKYAAKCKTPTLLIHSAEDYRCNLAEGMAMFSALKILGIPARMCVLNGENHELSRSGRPKNRIVRLTEILSWLDRYLKPDMAAAGESKEE